MLISIVGLNLEDLSVQYIRTETISHDKPISLYDDYEFIVPLALNPLAVKGMRNENGEVYIVEDPDKTYAWKEVRRRRAQLLVESDWTQFPDVSAKMEVGKKDAWIAYRQALRDITVQVKDPLHVVWPVIPH